MATNDNGSIKLTSVKGDAITVAEGTAAGGAALLGFGADAGVAKTTDELVSTINSTAALKDKVLGLERQRQAAYPRTCRRTN